MKKTGVFYCVYISVFDGHTGIEFFDSLEDLDEFVKDVDNLVLEGEAMINEDLPKVK